MSAKWTNAAEAARLAGLSRERVSKMATRRDFPNAVWDLSKGRPRWRLPVEDVNAWLIARGITPPLVWRKREPGRGHWDEIWVGY